MDSQVVGLLLAVIVGLAGAVFPLTAQRSPELTALEWQGEIDRVLRSIQTRHPGVPSEVDASVFEAAMAKLRDRAPELKGGELVVGIMSAVASLGDGHTRYDSENGSHGFDRLVPIVTYPLADGLFVTAATSDYADLVGGRVVLYGDVTAAEALRLVGATVSGDNPSGVLRGLPHALQRPTVLAAAGVSGRRDSLRVVIETPDGKQETRMLGTIAFEAPAFSLDSMTFFGKPPQADTHLRTPARLHWLKHPVRKPFAVEDMPDIDAIYFRLSQVRDTEPSTFAAAVRAAFDAFDGKSRSRLVIDLRDNPGGNNMLLRPLLHEVIRRPGLMRSGHTFVVTDRNTFSAAVNLVTRLTRETPALVVGESPAGSPNHYGDADVLYRYESDLTLMVSTLYWQDSLPWDERDAIEPDLPAPLSAEHLRTGEDPALLAIRAHVNRTEG